MRVRVQGLLRLALIVQSYLLCIGCFPKVLAQEKAATAQLDPLDETEMQAELKRLRGVCENLSLDAEAELCSRWIPKSRSDQSILFLPVEAQQANTANAKQAAWVKHFETARARHAEYWFRECRKAVEAGDEVRGYQLLWRTLRENPQHSEAKRTLGRLATSCSVRPVVRRSTAKHPTYGWAANAYTRVESPHFLLTSRATTAETIELAMKLEEFYALWTQYFFPLWAPPGVLKKRLDGSVEQFGNPHIQFRVVLLRNRDDYVATLGHEKNIGVSVGYYDPDRQTSYFFPDKNLSATFYHELTHQLLAEATQLKVASNIGSQGDAWLAEGIALYMESLSRFDDCWTLGGWDSRRLASARFNVYTGFFVSWAEFGGRSLDDMKSAPEIARLYSQAVGVIHVMLDQGDEAEKDRRKQAVFQSLVALYQGAPNSKPIINSLGGDLTLKNYKSDLTVKNEQILQLRKDRPLQELVLAGSQLSAEAWNKVTDQTMLEWLDVSFSNATTADLQEIGKLKALERLSVEGSAIDSHLLDSLRMLPKLSELDLTSCAIDDLALKKLTKLPKLSRLWIGKTQVTDDSLRTLAAMTQLKFVDIEDSKITDAAWAKFVESNPRFAPGR